MTLFTFLHAGTGASRTGSFTGIWGRGEGKRRSRLGRDSPFIARKRWMRGSRWEWMCKSMKNSPRWNVDVERDRERKREIKRERRNASWVDGVTVGIGSDKIMWIMFVQNWQKIPKSPVDLYCYWKWIIFSATTPQSDQGNATVALDAHQSHMQTTDKPVCLSC